MIFFSYWFVAFAAIVFPLYWVVPNATSRRLMLLAFCAVFHAHFAGPAGVLPIVILSLMTYVAGLSGKSAMVIAAIAANVGALLFYKYTLFLSEVLLGLFSPDLAKLAADYTKNTLLPAAPPLALSFFVFEFVHYLVDVRRGERPIRSPLEFGLFAVFWPSLVAGPIKRFEQFIPAVRDATARRTPASDITEGAFRVAIGMVKKVVADNLTAAIAFYGTQFATLPLSWRWAVLVMIAARILLDFSGYSDMAIGFARMMGIRLPENFRWPYLAVSPADFWRRWHISLSTWIRDYIYVPLGGGRVNPVRRGLNALIAFALCGLWHGASMNFALWGIYHGVGVSISVALSRWFESQNLGPRGARALVLATPFTWAATQLFVMIGWLLFFYPVSQAFRMAQLLFTAG